MSCSCLHCAALSCRKGTFADPENYQCLHLVVGLSDVRTSDDFVGKNKDDSGIVDTSGC